MGSDAGGAGPVEVEPMPGYWELITSGSGVMLSAWRDCSDCGLELSKQTLLDNAYITWTEIALFFFCAFLWTMIRKGLTESLFKVVVGQDWTSAQIFCILLLTHPSPIEPPTSCCWFIPSKVTLFTEILDVACYSAIIICGGRVSICGRSYRDDAREHHAVSPD
ncbi:hypothetical protein XENOCAPTIV_000491 [Xenoophorus captivus]|uniref:Uncharacterized protein n=1 Tax=Xenoophorus captivus TaxID=1517983 RepID=A0ABV0SEU7_9TELE